MKCALGELLENPKALFVPIHGIGGAIATLYASMFERGVTSFSNVDMANNDEYQMQDKT